MSDSQDELRKRFDSKREQHTDDTGNESNADNVGDRGNTGDGYDWGDKYNYPFYMPREFAEELDRLYNQYDGKNKVEGGEGLEKHREFLFPIMETAIEELDLDEVIEWGATDEER
jgi:hypothetical protein